MENGINSEIEFYVLDLDLKDSRSHEFTSISINGSYYDISFIAYKKDDEENGVMIDLLTGIEILPSTKKFEPMLRYKSKRLATLDELSTTSYLCSKANSNYFQPLRKYTDDINRYIEYSNDYYKSYIENMESILTFMFETKPNLDNEKSLQL